MLSLKVQNQHFLTKSKVHLGFEHAILRAIDWPLKILQDILSLTYSLFLAASLSWFTLKLSPFELKE